jgi:hypothetical protein
MWGTIWMNAWIGGFAFIITFLTALTGNVWLVSLERAVYAFLFFFIIAYPLRWLIAKITVPSDAHAVQQSETESSFDQAEEHSIPSGDDPSEAFTPLSFPTVKRETPAQDPATVADVIRRLTEE